MAALDLRPDLMDALGTASHRKDALLADGLAVFEGETAGDAAGIDTAGLNVQLAAAYGSVRRSAEGIDFPPDIHAGDITVDFVVDVPGLFTKTEAQHLDFDAVGLDIDAGGEQQDLIRQAFGVVELAPHHQAFRFHGPEVLFKRQTEFGVHENLQGMRIAIRRQPFGRQFVVSGPGTQQAGQVEADSITLTGMFRNPNTLGNSLMSFRIGPASTAMLADI